MDAPTSEVPGLDLGALGMNAGQIAVLCGLTDHVKAWIDRTPLGPRVARLYPVLPVLVGLGYELLISGGDYSAGIIKTGIKMGIYTAYAWNIKRVTLEGK